jgi:hypothetical protein
MLLGVTFPNALLLSTTVHADFFMDALESVRDAGVAVSGIVVDGYYGIGDVIPIEGIFKEICMSRRTQ